MIDVEQLTDQIREYSRLHDREDAPSDLKDELVSLASELRSREIPYHFEYTRPDEATFRLRSRSRPGSDALEELIQFLEPGRRLRVVLDDVTDEVFRGICAELTILGERDDPDEQTVREPELNLLKSRVFLAELYAEFQRSERYDSPFYVVSVALPGDVSWEPAAKALKHVSNRRDLLGQLTGNRVGGIFTSRETDPSFEDDLRERIELRYESDDLELNLLHIPDDVTDWSQLQSMISHSDSQEERDFVGHRGD